MHADLKAVIHVCIASLLRDRQDVTQPEPSARQAKAIRHSQAHR